MTHVTPAYAQQAYRARNDDGLETSATWKTAGDNTPWTQPIDETFRLRIAVGETAGGSSSNTTGVIQYSRNGGSFTNVGASTPIQYTTSANVNDGQLTTDQIGGAGAFRAGEISEGTNSVTASFSGNDHTEHEWVLLADADQLTAGDTITFRTTIDGATLTYSQTPTATIEFPPEPATFDVAITGTNAPVEEGTPLTVDYSVTNTGEEAGTQTVTLDAGGPVVDSEEVSLDAAASDTGTLTWADTVAGERSVTVASADTSDTAAVTIDEKQMSISGTVTDENATPLDGAAITVVRTDTEPPTIAAEETTAPDGTYAVSVPDAGTYHVAGKHDDGATEYAGASYPNIGGDGETPPPASGTGADLANADLYIPFDDTTYESQFTSLSDSGLSTRSIVDAPGRSGNQLQVELLSGEHIGTNMYHDHEAATGSQPTHVYHRFMFCFDPDFQTVLDGKLPGFGGRDNPDTDEGSGGGGASGVGWSARMGWNRPGDDTINPGDPIPLEYYTYHMDLGSTGGYGEHMLWDHQGTQFHANPGQWYEIEQEIDLGTVNTNDGELRAWVDGTLVFERTGLRFRAEGGNNVSRSWWNVYHGGGTPAPATVATWGDDFYIHRNGIP